MIIIDNGAFLEHYRTITIDNSDIELTVNINMPTGKYYKINALMNQIDTADSEEDKAVYLVLAFALLFGVTNDYVVDNIPPLSIRNPIDRVLLELKQIYIEDYALPEIEYETNDKAPNPDDKEAWKRYRNRQDIKSLNESVSKHEQVMTAMISYLLTHTNNSYFDLLKMPIFMFWATYRNIALSELRTNDDYNLAYLMNEYAMLKDCGEKM